MDEKRKRPAGANIFLPGSQKFSGCYFLQKITGIYTIVVRYIRLNNDRTTIEEVLNKYRTNELPGINEKTLSYPGKTLQL